MQVTKPFKTLAASILIMLGIQPAVAKSHNQLAGEATRILVLGTPHLSDMDEISDEHLKPLLARLEAFAPDVIAIEAVPGQTCELLRAHREVYPGVADTYCTDPLPARDALGLSAGAAELALAIELDGLGEDIPPEKHRSLAALLWATGDPWSAAMHWSLLSTEQRLASDQIDEDLASLLDRQLESANENRRIAGMLGANLGHTRLFPMDDHRSDSIMIFANPELPGILQEIWNADIGDEAALEAEADRLLGSPEGLLAYYRFTNSSEFQTMLRDADFGAAAQTGDANNAARSYVAWWHARNLRMAANIVESFGNRPGAKVLVITGNSHKAYLDRILGQFEDIELVNVDEVLAD